MGDVIDVLVKPAILAAVIAFIGSLVRDLFRHRTELRSTNTAILAEVQRLLESGDIRTFGTDFQSQRTSTL